MTYLLWRKSNRSAIESFKAAAQPFMFSGLVNFKPSVVAPAISQAWRSPAI